MFDNAIYLFIYEHKDTKTQRNNDKGRKVYKETSLDLSKRAEMGWESCESGRAKYARVSSAEHVNPSNLVTLELL